MKEPRVLVTGATGFIGRAVVRHLLDLGRPVTALARDRAGQSAAERVAAAVGAGAGDRRLRVVTGDLGTPRCGLTPAARCRLREDVQTVIHCAGDTVFFPEAITAFRRAHVGGPLELLSLLATGHLQRWAHLSTAFVCGRRSGTVLESEGDVGQEFHNPYERVKLEAETACRERGARLGIDVRIFRPGVVIGAAPATSGGAPAGVLFRFIRLLAGLVEEARGAPGPLRIEAAPRARFNAVPVEYVADAIVALTDLAEAAGQTMHLVVAEPPTQDAMLAMITDRLGTRGLVVVDGRPTSLVAPTPPERHVRALLARYRDYLAHEVHFDDTAARRLLARCGRKPATLSRADVDRLIDRALATEADGEPGVNVGRRAGAVGTPSKPSATPA